MSFMVLKKLKSIEWPITSNLIFSFIIFYIFGKYYYIDLYYNNFDSGIFMTTLGILLNITFIEYFVRKVPINIYWKFDTLYLSLWFFFINQKNDYFSLSNYDFFILAMIFLIPLTIKLAYNVITNSDEETLYNEENFFSKAMWILQFIGINFILTLKTLFSYNIKQILIVLAIIALINFIYFKYIQNKRENEWQFYILASLCYLIYIG